MRGCRGGVWVHAEGRGGRVVAGRVGAEGGLGVAFEKSQAATSRGEVMGLPATGLTFSCLLVKAVQHFEGKKCGGHFCAAGASGKIYPPIRARTR